MEPENLQKQKESDKNNILLLGIAFTAVFITSILSAALQSSIVGSAFNPITISDILVNIANNTTLMRISILVQLLTSIGVVFLAVMLFTVFKKENIVLSSIALGWWIVEAVMLLITVIGNFSMLLLSSEYSGSPENANILTLANVLYYCLSDYGFILHNAFFSLGGIIWYFQFYKYKYVPRALALWGLISICLFSVTIIIALYDPEIPMIIFFAIPYMPFEIVLGLWLIFKGKKE